MCSNYAADYVGWHEEVEFAYKSESLIPWPRFKVHRWLTYLVITMYNTSTIRICRFHKSVASWDRWPTDKAGQRRRFCCVYQSTKHCIPEAFKLSTRLIP